MLFNSIPFICIFLPLVLCAYFFAANKGNIKWSPKIIVLFGSILFYAYYKVSYVAILVTSIIINYIFLHFLFSSIIKGSDKNINEKEDVLSFISVKKRRFFLVLMGVLFNLSLLAVFKYWDFFVSNMALVLPITPALLNLSLPLGISFFTFQQITYLVDTYQGKSKRSGFLDYSLFVVFFPQLVAGPIVHYKEMLPQFASQNNKTINWSNIYQGTVLFSIGLAKKMMIADTLSLWVDAGFKSAAHLSFWHAWQSSLCYTFQLYFDFSGYWDMAAGAALLFNIVLPLNFNSPYKAKDIQDFWRRWHISLSRFFRDYIYIPLGGSRFGGRRAIFCILVTFFLTGLWHGAGWTFIVWGILHGLALIVNILWKKQSIRLGNLSPWLITFLFINGSWVIFRANNLNTAWSILSSMLGLNGFGDLAWYKISWYDLPLVSYLLFLGFDLTPLSGYLCTIFLIIASFIAVFMPNSQQIIESYCVKRGDSSIMVAWSGLLLGFSILLLFSNKVTPFLYFNF